MSASANSSTVCPRPIHDRFTILGYSWPRASSRPYSSRHPIHPRSTQWAAVEALERPAGLHRPQHAGSGATWSSAQPSQGPEGAGAFYVYPSLRGADRQDLGKGGRSSHEVRSIVLVWRRTSPCVHGSAFPQPPFFPHFPPRPWRKPARRSALFAGNVSAGCAAERVSRHSGGPPQQTAIGTCAPSARPRRPHPVAVGAATTPRLASAITPHGTPPA